MVLLTLSMLEMVVSSKACGMQFSFATAQFGLLLVSVHLVRGDMRRARRVDDEGVPG